MLLVLSGLFAMQSCTNEDKITPEVKQAWTQPVLATSPTVRTDGTVLFTGTTVDLIWTSEGSGTQKWHVYFGTTDPPPSLQENVAQESLTVTVEDGQTYFWKVGIADSEGIVTTSEVSSFTAISGTNPEINLSLTTTTDVLSAVGIDLTADEVVDLRMLILDKSDMSVVETVDNGYANEDFADFGTLDDGEYLIGVDIFSTLNFGDLNTPINLSFALQFDQLGILNTTLDFPDVMTNANPCNLYRTYLAIVKKVGAAYTITKDVSYMIPSILTWKGTDAGSPSQVTTTASCAGKTMTGLGFGWMLDYWGEIITSGGTLTYTNTATTITIPLQKYCKTTYLGAPQPEYYIQGTGTIDNSGAFPVWTIRYDFKQGSTWIAAVSGWPTPYFDAVITTNPAKGTDTFVMHVDKAKR
jgi:hypothetical protein